MPFCIEAFVAATFTPMREDGSINLEAIDQYQKFLKDRGVHHVYVNGSTGEGTSLTTKERKLIAEKWVQLSRLPNRAMKVLIQVGGTNFSETIELTEHASAIGADAVSTLAPLYFLPASLDELVDYCRSVAEKAPDIPLYYYHIPDRTGVRLNMEEFLRKSRHVIPSLRGIKFSSKDLFEGCLCLQTLDANGDRYDLLFGCDEQVISAFAIGFRGAIGSTYSLIPRVYQRLWKALEEGKLDEARKHQFKSVDLVKVFFDFGNRTGGILPAMKAALAELGVNVGPTRYPMQQLDETSKAKLMANLKDIGFFDWQD